MPGDRFLPWGGALVLPYFVLAGVGTRFCGRLGRTGGNRKPAGWHFRRAVVGIGACYSVGGLGGLSSSRLL